MLALQLQSQLHQMKEQSVTEAQKENDEGAQL